MTFRAEGVTRHSQGLSGPQQVALAALTGGSGFKEAAGAAGVNRTTLYRWSRLDPLFRAAYEAWKQAIRESGRGRLLAAAESSLSRVIDTMEEDGRFAFRVIQGLGLYADRGATPVDVERVRRQIELERREEECQISLRRARLADLKAKVIDITPGQGELPQLEEVSFQAEVDFEPADEAPSPEVVEPAEVENAGREEAADSGPIERDACVEPDQRIHENDEASYERRRLAEIGNLTLFLGIAAESGSSSQVSADNAPGEPRQNAEPSESGQINASLLGSKEPVLDADVAPPSTALPVIDVLPMSDPAPASSACPGLVESKPSPEDNRPAAGASTVDDAALANQRMEERMEEIHTLFQIQGDLLDDEPRERLINEFETLGRKVERYRRALRAQK